MGASRRSHRSAASELKERWLTSIKDEHLLGCFLDPRFKHLNFLDNRTRKFVKDRVAQELSDYNAKQPARPVVAKQHWSLDEFLDEEDSPVVQDEEMKRYNDLPKLPLKADVLSWWNRHAKQFPGLGTNSLISYNSLCSPIGAEILGDRRDISRLRKAFLPCRSLSYKKQSVIGLQKCGADGLPEWECGLA